jgi:hypothetical protein
VDRRFETILELLPRIGPQAKLLDVGCLEGSYTRLYADAIGSRDVHDRPKRQRTIEGARIHLVKIFPPAPISGFWFRAD